MDLHDLHAIAPMCLRTLRTFVPYAPSWLMYLKEEPYLLALRALFVRPKIF